MFPKRESHLLPLPYSGTLLSSAAGTGRQVAASARMGAKRESRVPIGALDRVFAGVFGIFEVASNTKLGGADEHDIYRVLGIPYVEPHERG